MTNKENWDLDRCKSTSINIRISDENCRRKKKKKILTCIRKKELHEPADTTNKKIHERRHELLLGYNRKDLPGECKVPTKV